MTKFGKQVCVLGGAGYVGQAVITELTKAGYQVKLALRFPQRRRELSLIPGVELVEIPVLNEESLKQLFNGVTFVVNLLTDQSVPSETVPEAGLVKITHSIKRIAETSGVQRLIHLSQIGASSLQAKSSWLRVLGETEGIIHNMNSTVPTILRAGLLVGEKDTTTSLYKKQLDICPLLMVANGKAQVKPLSVKDFAKALVKTLENSAFFKQRVDLVGDEVISIKDLARFVQQIYDKKALVMSMCQLNAKFMMKLGFLAPIKTVNAYQQKQLTQDLLSSQDFTSTFGFAPESLESLMSEYIYPNNVRDRYGYFREAAGRKAEELK